MKHAWRTSTGPDRYRRGMYTFYVPGDAAPAAGGVRRARRDQRVHAAGRSNTPLQALTLLNDEAFVEFAQGLAHRDDAGRRRRRRRRGSSIAFRLCTWRKPHADELEVLTKLLERQRSAFAISADGGGGAGE